MSTDEQSALGSAQEELMRSLTGTSDWGSMGTSGGNRANKESQLEHYKQCERVARPFMGEVGQEALEELRRRTMEQPTWPYRQSEAAMLPYYGCAREGQNQIVRYIEYCIRTVETGPPAEGE